MRAVKTSHLKVLADVEGDLQSCKRRLEGLLQRSASSAGALRPSRRSSELRRKFQETAQKPRTGSGRRESGLGGARAAAVAGAREAIGGCSSASSAGVVAQHPLLRGVAAQRSAWGDDHRPPKGRMDHDPSSSSSAVGGRIAATNRTNHGMQQAGGAAGAQPLPRAGANASPPPSKPPTPRSLSKQDEGVASSPRKEQMLNSASPRRPHQGREPPEQINAVVYSSSFEHEQGGSLENMNHARSYRGTIRAAASGVVGGEMIDPEPTMHGLPRNHHHHHPQQHAGVHQPPFNIPQFDTRDHRDYQHGGGHSSIPNSLPPSGAASRAVSAVSSPARSLASSGAWRPFQVRGRRPSNEQREKLQRMKEKADSVVSSPVGVAGGAASLYSRNGGGGVGGTSSMGAGPPPAGGGVVQQNKSSVEQRGGHFAQAGDRRIFGMMGGGFV